MGISILNGELEVIRLANMRLVPSYLIEQVKGVEWSWREINIMWEVLENNPNHFLWALIDKDAAIKGIVWLVVDSLEKAVFLPVISVDKQYQVKGVVKELDPLIRKLGKHYGMKYALWATTRPKALESLGYERHQRVLMRVAAAVKWRLLSVSWLQ